MSKYFSINGYWKDDNEPFEGYVVKEYDDVGEDDNEVFYYGLSEYDLQQCLNQSDGNWDFVITSYEEIES